MPVWSEIGSRLPDACRALAEAGIVTLLRSAVVSAFALVCYGLRRKSAPRTRAGICAVNDRPLKETACP